MSSEIIPDQDPLETREWTESIDSVIEREGVERANFLLDQTIYHAMKAVSNHL